MLPIAPSISLAMERAAKEMSIAGGYQGYIENQGLYRLREKIADLYYDNKFCPEEILFLMELRASLHALLPFR